MKNSSYVSLSKNLRWVIITIATLFLIITASIFLIFEFNSYKINLLNQQSVLAKMISFNSTVALSLDDKRIVKMLFNSLQTEPSIILATIYKKNLREFSIYQTSLLFDKDETRQSVAMMLEQINKNNHLVSSMNWDHLDILTTVLSDDKIIGYLYIKTNLDPLYEHIISYALMILMICILFFCLIYFSLKHLAKSRLYSLKNHIVINQDITKKKEHSMRTILTDNNHDADSSNYFNIIPDEIKQHNNAPLSHGEKLEEQDSEPDSQLIKENIEVVEKNTKEAAFKTQQTETDRNIVVKNRPNKIVPSTVSADNSQILLAEDNIINQMFVKEMFNLLGLQLTVVENGQMALDEVIRNDYDLILMDCHMPVMDGFKSTKKIREQADEAYKNVPIIALTADIQNDIINKCFTSGMDDYLSKPYKKADLLAIINKWLVVPISSPIAENTSSLLADKKDSEELLSNKILPIDNSVLDGLIYQDKADLVINLIKVFLDFSPEKIEQLFVFADLCIWKDLKETAHSLKSSSGSLGAKYLSRLCADLEHSEDQELDANAKNLVKLIKSEFIQVVNELTQLKLNLEQEIFQSTDGIIQNKSNNKINVLLVDDDPAFRAIVTMTLSDEGVTTIAVNSGEECLTLLEREKKSQYLPDLILLDALMDGMDGFETCQLLRAKQYLKSIPVIMVTGLDDASSVESGFAVGADDFISKPVNFSILVQMIHFHLQANHTL